MKEYLKKYKELLKQLEINKSKIQENTLLFNENYSKWEETKDEQEKLELEISELKKEYNNQIDKKTEKFFDKWQRIITILSIVILILLAIFNPLYFLFSAPILVAFDAIFGITFLLIKLATSIFENKFKKDKDITKLLENIDKKENELTNIKTICNEYSQNIIKYQSMLKQFEDKQVYINNSIINKLMADYATPIFDEQLKTTQEEQNDKPLIKTKKPNHQSNHTK